MCWRLQLEPQTALFDEASVMQRTNALAEVHWSCADETKEPTGFLRLSCQFFEAAA